MTENTAGGAAAAGGMDYQSQCAAWVSVQILASTVAPAVEGLWIGALERVDCETGEPVDDIRVIPKSGRAAVMQCKRRLTLTEAADGEFGKTVDQFVRQRLAPGHEDDQLVLVTTSETSASIRNTLRVLLGRIRTAPGGDGIETVTNNATEENVLERVLAHLRRAWKAQTGLEPSAAETRALLRNSHVLILDLDPGQAAELTAHATLSAVIADPTQIPSAWAHLNSHADSMAKNRAGTDVSGLQQYLTSKQLKLVGVIEFQAAVAKLKQLTARELDRLDGGPVAIPGPSGDISIVRAIISEVEVAAAAGPVLVTGAPGSGKTVSVHHLARSIQAAGGEVAFLAVGNIKAGSLGELHNELGLGSPLYDVLAQWAPGTRKTLVIDSLDAARGDGQPDLWRQVIDYVRTHLPDWQVVATVRSWDLQHSKHLTRLFPTPPVTVGDLDDTELANAATGWPELVDLVTKAPPTLLALVRNPYNLRLAADLLVNGFPLGTLAGLDSQIQLLDNYWEQRVTSGTGGGARGAVTHAISRHALSQHAMTVDTSAVVAGDVGATAALGELLSRAVLIDATALPHPGLPSVVRYAHHVLHDFALSLEFLGTTGLLGEVQRDPNLAIAAAPSVEFHLQRIWDADPSHFWMTVIELHNSGVAGLVVVQAADVAARNLTDVSQLATLLDLIGGGAAASPVSLLRYLSLAHVLDRRATPSLPAAPWAQLALALSDALDRTELVVRILVSELAQLEPPITGDELAAVGTAARAALEYLWTGAPGLVDRIAIESVILTAASDPTAADALLRRALEPERLDSHGPADLWQITDGVPFLIAVMPGFVKDLYVIVMRHEETSREATDMVGGQILPLRSNRRQDIESAKYNLVEHFGAVLRGNPEVALDILRSVVPTRAINPTDETREVNAHIVTITLDGSEWFDESDYANGADAAGLLEKFEGTLAVTDTPAAWLDLLATSPTPAVVWRRVLSAAARNACLAAELGPLDQLVGALALAPLGSELAKVLASRFREADDDTKRRVEEVVLALQPTEGIEDEPSYYRDQMYRHLLHALDRDAVTDHGKAAMDATTRPIERTFHIGGAVGYDPNYGIDLPETADGRVAELIAAIRPFAHAYFNDTPSSEQLEAADSSAIDELESLLADGYAGALASQANEALTAVAVIWARTSREIGGHFHPRARSLLLRAMNAEDPKPGEGHDDGHELRVIHTGPRNDAARGLTALARLSEHADEELLGAILTLSRDPVSSLRNEVVVRLSYMRETAPDLIWQILEERAASDPAEFLLVSVVYEAWKLRSDMARLSAVVDTVVRRATPGRGRHGAVAACAEVAALMWVRFGVEAVRSVVDRILNLDHLDADAISSVLHTLRESECFTDDDEWTRHRALEICSALVAEASGRLARLAVEPPPTDDEVPPLRQAAMLLDSVAQQLYFAAGVHDAKQDGRRSPLPHEIRLIEEATPVFDQLAAVSLAPVAHHLVETHAFIVDVRPSQALVAISKVVTRGGRASGYAIESLAVGTLVKVVTQLLADHRAIFKFEENLTALRSVLEVFIEAGSPEAHQLIYGLESVLR